MLLFDPPVMFAERGADGHADVPGRVIPDQQQAVSSEPPNRLVHTYHSLWPPMNEDTPTKVTWELEPMSGNVTQVTVVHEDFQGETATYKGLQDSGWTWILSNMKMLLETGEPMPQGY